MKTSKRLGNGLIMGVLLALGLSVPAFADEGHMSIDWRRLQLGPEQERQIQTLEGRWTQEYMSVQPSIVDDQRKLQSLLADPKADPVEIMSLQQSLTRKKEQLRAAATASYLKKRQVLSTDQQKSLEDMIRQSIAERQRMMSPGAQADVMPDRIQILMQRVRNIWPH